MPLSVCGKQKDMLRRSESDAPDDRLTTVDVPESERIYPDGGLRAWATVVGSMLVQMSSFGTTISFGVYQDFYMRHYMVDTSPSAISWIGGLNSFLLVAGGIVSGRLYDRGYFYHLLYGGSLVSIISMFLLSFAQPNRYYQALLAQGVGAGLGGALIYTPSLAIISEHFDKRRSLAMSLSSTGIAIGSVVQPLLLNNLLSNPRIGFGNAIRAEAGLQAGLLLAACSLMRTSASSSPGKACTTNTVQQLKKTFKDGPFVASLFGFVLFTIGWYFLPFYIQLEATERGVNETMSKYLIVIMNATGILGGILAGLMANTLGVGNIIIITTTSSAALIFAMLGLRNVAGFVVVVVIYGFFSAVFGALAGPLVSILTEDISELGMRLGVNALFHGVGALIGPPIAGALLTDAFIWWRPILFSGLAALMSSFSFRVTLWLFDRKKAVSESDVPKQSELSSGPPL